MLHDKLAYILYIVVNESKDSCKYLFLSFVFQVRLCIAFGYFGLKNFSYDLFVFWKFHCACVILVDSF